MTIMITVAKRNRLCW